MTKVPGAEYRARRTLRGMRRPMVLLALPALALVGLASCGSDDDTVTTVPAAPAATTAADAGGASATAVQLLTPAEADALIADGASGAVAGLVVLDVRTPEEFAAGHLAGAVNVDFYAASFADDLAALDRTVPYLVYCHSGNRSGKATQAMQQLGFTTIYDLDGGVTAWQAAGYSLTV